jgi:hypothetical protein
MSCHVARVFLSATIIALLHASHALAQQPPPGYQLLTAPQASGGLLLVRRPAAPSAVQLLRQGFHEVAPFFDGRPQALGGYADRGERYAEAVFRASSRQLPLAGVAFSIIGKDAGTLGFAFDTPHTFAQSLPILLQLTGGQTSAATACAPPPQHWQIVPFPDGSGQMELPEGWRVTGGSRGTGVTAEGPHGVIVRAAQSIVMTRAAAARLPQPPFPVADPTDPVTPFQAVGTYWSALRAQQGLPVVRVTRILRVTPMRPPAGFLHDAFLEAEVDFQGRPYHAVAHVLVSGVTGGTFLYQESGGGAPSECFAEHLPTLMRILGSAQTASHVIAEALQRAARSQRESHDIWWDATRNQERARDRMASNWTEAFRGTRIVQDTQTGARHDVNLAYSADLVRRLNQGEGYDRYREIPLWELNQ